VRGNPYQWKEIIPLSPLGLSTDSDNVKVWPPHHSSSEVVDGHCGNDDTQDVMTRVNDVHDDSLACERCVTDLERPEESEQQTHPCCHATRHGRHETHKGAEDQNGYPRGSESGSQGRPMCDWLLVLENMTYHNVAK